MKFTPTQVERLTLGKGSIGYFYATSREGCHHNVATLYASSGSDGSKPTVLLKLSVRAGYTIQAPNDSISAETLQRQSIK